MLCLSQNPPRDKRANRVVLQAWWSDTRPMAERQVFMLGRNSVKCPLDKSYVTGSAREAGAAAELATS